MLNTMYLPVPPLRERREDIGPLLDYFTAYYARRTGAPLPRLTQEWSARCRAHYWPGNVRELQMIAALFADSNRARCSDGRPRICRAHMARTFPGRGLALIVDTQRSRAHHPAFFLARSSTIQVGCRRASPERRSPRQWTFDVNMRARSTRY